MGTRTALSYPWVRWFGVLRAFSSSRSRSRSRSRCVAFRSVLSGGSRRVGRDPPAATHPARPTWTRRDPPGPGPGDAPRATHPDPARPTRTRNEGTGTKEPERRNQNEGTRTKGTGTKEPRRNQRRNREVKSVQVKPKSKSKAIILDHQNTILT